MTVIASRSFTAEDQAAFAAFSGDHNPMHMDPVAARRTQAGAPVVHGVHTLLWALDQLAASDVPVTNLATIAVQFSRFVYLNQTVTLTVTRRDERAVTAELVRDGLTLATISLRFGPRTDKDAPPNLLEAPDSIVADPLPNAPTMEDIATLRGWMPPVSTPSAAHAIAPSLIEALGLPRVRGIGLLSRLVGMICPGLHSIFTGIRVDLVSRTPDRAGVGFSVASWINDSGLPGSTSPETGCSARLPPRCAGRRSKPRRSRPWQAMSRPGGSWEVRRWSWVDRGAWVP